MEGSIRMLVLDVVMVCELMSSALEALVPQQQQQQQQEVPSGEKQPAPPAAAAEQGVGGQASGQQPFASMQYNSIANAINCAIRSKAYEAFLTSKGGKVHVAYLYMVSKRAQGVTRVTLPKVLCQVLCSLLGSAYRQGLRSGAEAGWLKGSKADERWLLLGWGWGHVCPPVAY